MSDARTDPETSDRSRGWPSHTMLLPAISLCLAAGSGLLVWRAANDFGGLVARLEIASVVFLAFGLGFRSERIVAFATAPALIGLVVGATGSTQIAWGSALIVGCLWYLAVEVALSSIEWSGGLQVSATVLQRRLLDVASVLLFGVAAALVGVLLAGWAPERTIAARVVVLVVVLGALVAGVRHLGSVDPAEVNSDEQDEDAQAEKADAEPQVGFPIE